jgi:N-acetyl-anhydromuramyl-L-alanine amidase AmpD
MRSVKGVVIHCSASPNGRWTTAPDIDRWHDERGFERQPYWRERFNPDYKAIGYHFVIYTNGAIATGRHLDEIGAHAGGYNKHTVGVCLIGTDKFPAEQWEALAGLVERLLERYPAAKVLGHRDLPDVNKICPGFDVAAWLAADRRPPEGHVLDPEHA